MAYHKKRFFVTVLCVAVLLFTARGSLAATINVDSACSLANAIRSANGDSQVSPNDSCETGDSGADTIVLSANVTLTQATQLPDVTSAITLRGGVYNKRRQQIPYI